MTDPANTTTTKEVAMKHDVIAGDLARRNDLLRFAHLRRSAILERRKREDGLLAAVDAAGEDDDAIAIAAGELLAGSTLADQRYSRRLGRNVEVVLLDLPGGGEPGEPPVPITSKAA